MKAPLEEPILVSDQSIGTITTPVNAITQRDELCQEAEAVVAVGSAEQLETAVSYLKDIATFLKKNEESRKKEKRPHIDFNKLVDDFAAQFAAPLERVKSRLTEMVNGYQRKQLEEKQERDRKALEDQRKAAAEEAKAKAAEEKIRAALENASAEQAPIFQAAMLNTQLEQERAALKMQAAEAQLAIPTNTPRGLVTKTRYDFEITHPLTFIAKHPNWFTWKKEDEAFKLDRAGLLKALNNDEHEWADNRPPDGQQSVQHVFGIRIFSSTTTHTR